MHREEGENRGPAPRVWKAVLFDLDGTLVDTRRGMKAALAAAFLEVEGIELGEGSADFSLALDDMITSAHAMIPSTRVHAVAAAYRRHYDAGWWKVADVYPGAEAGLRCLAMGGMHNYVVTNKRASAARRILSHFALDAHLDGIEGQPDSGTPLPKSILAERCIERSCLDAVTTVVVGDSNSDAAMARSHGMTFIAVTSGAGPLGHAADGEDRVEVGSLAEVAALVLNGMPGRQS